MKKGFIGVGLLIGIAVLITAFYASYEVKQFINKTEDNRLGAVTALTDTIGTFRTNVNATDEALRSTTSTDPGHKHTTSSVTGVFNTASGGTGTSTLISGAIITGNGTSSVGFIAPTQSGQLVISSGTTWVANSLTAGTNITITTSTGGISIAALAITTTFSYTGATSSWTVPSGVNFITIYALGAVGGKNGGLGGFAAGTLYTTPGTTYYYCVGGSGGIGSSTALCGGGSPINGASGGGGGTSWFSTSSTFSTSSVLIVGAGGGGGTPETNGGNGGGTTGSTGGGPGGTGGLQTAGGTGSLGGTNGQEGRGGDGTATRGGGGGGGYFGGGGGGNTGATGTGGGGGSSFVSSNLVGSGVVSGMNNATGTITISYIRS